MPRLRVQEVAEAKGINMSQLQRQSGVTMPSVRRYWYNTRDGKRDGPPLREIDLVLLGAMARVLGVQAGELIDNSDNNESEEEPGQLVARPQVVAAA